MRASVTTPRITRVSVKHENDLDPDTPEEWAIDRASGEYIAALPDDYKLPDRGQRRIRNVESKTGSAWRL